LNVRDLGRDINRRGSSNKGLLRTQDWDGKNVEGKLQTVNLIFQILGNDPLQGKFQSTL